MSTPIGFSLTVTLQGADFTQDFFHKFQGLKFFSPFHLQYHLHKGTLKTFQYLIKFYIIDFLYLLPYYQKPFSS